MDGNVQFKRIGKAAASLALLGFISGGVLAGCDTRTSRTTEKRTTETPAGTVTETHKDEVKVDPK
jgi:hypothetical protein